jgi:hypothetical protein
MVISLPDGGRIRGGHARMASASGSGSPTSPHGVTASRIEYKEGGAEGQTEVFHENGLTYYTGPTTWARAGEWIFYDEQGNEVKRGVRQPGRAAEAGSSG